MNQTEKLLLYLNTHPELVRSTTIATVIALMLLSILNCSNPFDWFASTATPTPTPTPDLPTITATATPNIDATLGSILSEAMTATNRYLTDQAHFFATVLASVSPAQQTALFASPTPTPTPTALPEALRRLVETGVAGTNTALATTATP